MRVHVRVCVHAMNSCLYHVPSVGYRIIPSFNIRFNFIMIDTRCYIDTCDYYNSLLYPIELEGK